MIKSATLKSKKILMILSLAIFNVLLPYAFRGLKNEFKFPDGFFHYPPVDLTYKLEMTSSFERFVHDYQFYLVWILAIFTLAVYCFPNLFGFKYTLTFEQVKIARKEFLAKIKFNKFPIWFWLGLAVWLLTYIVSSPSSPLYLQFDILDEWLAYPLWWGFVFFLDGIAFKFNGDSLFSSNKRKMFLIALSSIFSWLLYDYLNAFVYSWIFPNGGNVSKYQFWFYAITGSSVFSVLVFEWYDIVKNLTNFGRRFEYGKKLKLTRKTNLLILFLLLGGMYLTVTFPFALFWLIWICPPLFIIYLFITLGMKKNISEIVSNGNWTFVAYMMITFFIQGIILEFWNYYLPHNLCFWKYDMPIYGNDTHIFEMPFFGYLGYLPFSLNCWLWYKVFEFLLSKNKSS